MTLALFAFISWAAIIIFLLIPKHLSKVENIIVFFCVTIIILSLFSITHGNLKLIWYSKNPEMFFSLWLHRNIILPLCLLIFVNYLDFMQTRFGKIAMTIAVLLVSYFIEYLTIWTGVRKFTGWNGYLTIIMLLVLMIFSAFLKKGLKKIQ